MQSVLWECASRAASRGAVIRRQRVEETFEGLFQLYGQRAKRLALALTGDPELAEDIAQEMFVRLFSRLAHLRHRDAVWGYMRTTIVNLARTHFRRSRIERSHLARAGEGTSIDPIVDLVLHDELFRQLQALPYRQRAAVVLRFCEDLSEEATADALHTTTKAVNGLVNRGLDTLRRRSREGMDE